MSATSLIDKSRGVDSLSSGEMFVTSNHFPKRNPTRRVCGTRPSLLSPASIFVEIKRRLILELGGVRTIAARCRSRRLAGPTERRQRGQILLIIFDQNSCA